MEAVRDLSAHALSATVSVVIPTYRREQVLIETLQYLLTLNPGPSEILVIDQTPGHEEETERRLQEFEELGVIRWIRLSRPSITRAMNLGLQEARSEIVLFLDDDIIPGPELIAAHIKAHQQDEFVVAGQVIQQAEGVSKSPPPANFHFASDRKQYITELMGGNFSIRRSMALRLGGFDENFVQVAYRFEAEFAERALQAGNQILFEPRASIRHLKAASGGTRSFGHHLTTLRPGHAVGAYYFLLRSKTVPHRFLSFIKRPIRAIRTKHHMRQPWWIPATLAAEAMGFIWAVSLYLRGPRRLPTMVDNRQS